MKNTNKDELKKENIKKNQDMVVEKTVDDLIEKLKEKGIAVSEEKKLITDVLERGVMLSHLALMFS